MEQPAFHGSPYKFDAFELAHIGSSEGCASFGWGLYFSGARAVAASYSSDQGLDGATVPAIYNINGVTTDRGTPEQKAADLIFGTGLAKARKLAKEMLDEARSGEEWTLRKGLRYYEQVFAITHSIASARHVRKAPGCLYEVMIPSDDRLLHWESPLCEQPGPVKQRLGPLAQDSRTGEQFYRLTAAVLGSDHAASRQLHALGIPGIRYQDAFQRQRASETFNFVVFDTSSIRMLCRSHSENTSSPAGLPAVAAAVAKGLPAPSRMRMS